jgi:SAM-dependent methyltransferase
MAAGLQAGMSCLDVGCGSGDVTLKMAALVVAEGSVVGVDRDQSILQLASQEAERQGLPVSFRRSNIEELAGESAYDSVFARYLLSHLPRPQGAVELMVRAVRPGGHLVLEDVFFPGHICYPANAAFDRYLELYQAVGYCEGGRGRGDQGAPAGNGARGWAGRGGHRARRTHFPRWRGQARCADYDGAHKGGGGWAPGWCPAARWIMSSPNWAGSPTTTGR